jgi:hypothetical protein
VAGRCDRLRYRLTQRCSRGFQLRSLPWLLGRYHSSISSPLIGLGKQVYRSIHTDDTLLPTTLLATTRRLGYTLPNNNRETISSAAIVQFRPDSDCPRAAAWPPTAELPGAMVARVGPCATSVVRWSAVDHHKMTDHPLALVTLSLFARCVHGMTMRQHHHGLPHQSRSTRMGKSKSATARAVSSNSSPINGST